MLLKFGQKSKELNYTNSHSISGLLGLLEKRLSRRIDRRGFFRRSYVALWYLWGGLSFCPVDQRPFASILRAWSAGSSVGAIARY
jgi:hypothetical protein